MSAIRGRAFAYAPAGRCNWYAARAWSSTPIGAAALAAAVAVALAGAPAPPWAPPSASDAPVEAVPVVFEANRGQTDRAVEFTARSAGYTLFLTRSDARFVLPSGAGGEAAVVIQRLAGADPPAAVDGRGRLPGVVNYTAGSDPRAWVTGAPTFASVVYDDVYQGIDLVYHSRRGLLEYDFVVAPGAEPGDIGVVIEGAGRIEAEPSGDVVVHTPAGPLRQHAPRAYQDVAGERVRVAASFTVDGRRIGFELGPYDRDRRLVIDPTLVYAARVGGSRLDEVSGIARDTAGSAYVAGGTYSADFPTVAGSGRDVTCGTDGGCNGLLNPDVFVTKLDSTGSVVQWSTYLGGSGGEGADAIALAGSTPIVVGGTSSTDFPTTASGHDGTLNGGDDGFVTKLTNVGAVSYSTFVGGSGSDHVADVAVRSNIAYVAGTTDSGNFPTTTGAYDTSPNAKEDAFMASINPAISGAGSLTYSTYVGGKGEDAGNAVAVSAVSNVTQVYVTGSTESTDFPLKNEFDATCGRNGQCDADSPNQVAAQTDAFVTRIQPSGGGAADLVYSTYLGGGWVSSDSCGGNPPNGTDEGRGIAAAAAAVFVTGYTAATDFPTKSAFSSDPPCDPPQPAGDSGDAFVTKISTASSGAASLTYSTYLGGGDFDVGEAITVAGNFAYVAGWTISGTATSVCGTCTPFPTTAGMEARPPIAEGINPVNGFVTKVGTTGNTLVYSTYVGGTSPDYAYAIAVDNSNPRNSFVAGRTDSASLWAPASSPTMTCIGPCGSGDALVVKITD